MLIYADLVSAYPSVSFHTGSQRLGLGMPDGCVILFDVRTATRLQIFEGHRSAVSAVAISPDGKLVASFYSADGTVRLWQTTQGFFASVTGSSNNRIARTLQLVKQPVLKSPASVIETVRLDWVTPFRLMLRNGTEEYVADVPST